MSDHDDAAGTFPLSAQVAAEFKRQRDEIARLEAALAAARAETADAVNQELDLHRERARVVEEKAEADLAVQLKALYDTGAELDAARAEATRYASERDARIGACEVCWTSSWVPVTPDDPDASEVLRGPFQGKFVRCDYCWQEGQFNIARKALDDMEQKYRRTLWLRHHVTTEGLYGDDGEMQCNRCMIDFKRQPVEQIEAQLAEQSWTRAAHPTPEVDTKDAARVERAKHCQALHAQPCLYCWPAEDKQA